MKAVQYRTIGAPPEVVEIDTPAPGPGQVLLKVTAAGLCHSDEFIMSLPEDQYVYGLPLTLGHEGAGVVEALGEGTTGIDVGASVLVYGPWGCGACRACAVGAENYCVNAAALGIVPPGLGAPGAMAEYMIVDSPRHLVPIGDMDPVKAVPLTDAGLTPYHAVKRALPKLGAGTTAVVIGVGGLGHLGVQMIKQLSGAAVIALDIAQDKLDLARSLGADHVLTSDASAAEAIRELTGGTGADVVIDFVGAQPTVELAMTSVAIDGQVTIVGVGPGVAGVGFFTMPFGVDVGTTYWGSRRELMEVVSMAERGQLDIHTETFSLDDAPQAYERMHEGSLLGRAVVVP